MLLADRVCVVAGVGPGMGQAIVHSLARHGAAVVLAARTESYLEEVAAAVKAEGGRTLTVPTNIVDPDQCKRLFDTTVAEFGRVDVLVSAAFRPDVFQPFEDVGVAAWRKIFEVNVFGTLQVVEAVIPHMKAQGGGSIVLINSSIIRKPLPKQGGYAASKGALMSAAHALARELGQYKIRVNSVVPGWMMGPPVQMYLDWQSQERGITPEQVYDEVASEIALGEIPTQEACADSVVFFASDLSRAVTGASLDVNGGEVFH